MSYQTVSATNVLSTSNIVRANFTGWKTLEGGMHYFHLLNYYPAWMDRKNGFCPTKQETLVRHLIWNFKYDPSRGITHEKHVEAAKSVVELLSGVLKKTFGETISNVTLFCAPASSQCNYQRRIEDFATLLCAKTGAQNSYSHVKYVRDATPKHSGGSGMPAVNLDADYFRGKKVLIFDDVTTSGGTLQRYKQVLDDLGAIVIGGVCIGKTCWERENDNPIGLYLKAA